MCWSRVCRFQAARSADARSSEMIISDAIIWIMRDALRCGNTYGSQPGQWITLEGCISLLSTFFPVAVAASVALTVAGMSTKKRSLTSLVLRRPIVGSSSIWTVIHKSQTCILVRGPTRQPEPPRITRLLCFTEKQFQRGYCQFQLWINSTLLWFTSFALCVSVLLQTLQ